MSRPKTAESNFRAAFKRLKNDEPNTLPKGTPITPSNVAREAGKKPDSLRCDRYPRLCKEIKAYTEVNVNKADKPKLKPSRAKESAKKRIKRLTLENERLTNIVVTLSTTNKELELEISRLKAGKVVNFDR